MQSQITFSMDYLSMSRVLVPCSVFFVVFFYINLFHLNWTIYFADFAIYFANLLWQLFSLIAFLYLKRYIND